MTDASGAGQGAAPRANPRANQKELNEFVLDTIEFFGKHFPSWFDKTRVAGGNEGVSVRIRRAASGSELEITTDRLDPHIDFGPARWHFREQARSREALFAALLADLTAVFTDRIVVVSGFNGGKSVGSLMFRDLADAEALDRLRGRFPECDQAAVKRWSTEETPVPPRDA